MLGKIIYISDNVAHIKLENKDVLATNMMNLHIIFEDDKKKILGEVEDINEDIIKVRFLGEIVNDKFIGGVIRKPNLTANIRVITRDEVKYLVGENNKDSILLGYSPLYDEYPIYANINDLFNSNLSIFGNTGSGKSCGVARLIQNIFSNPNLPPLRSNIFIFDAYGEYHNAFSKINEMNPYFHFKFYKTYLNNTDNNNFGEQLRIPLWLLNVDDMALLLDATTPAQLPIIEKMMKIATIFSQNNKEAEKYKDHLIAKAIMTVLYTNKPAASKRNDIFSIIAMCSTPNFNLEANIQGVGYTRKFRDCFMIDKSGEFNERILITDYVSKMIDESLDSYETKEKGFYSLKDLENALNFTLISEGLLNNDQTYSDAIFIKVRLHSLAISENAKFFSYPEYINEEAFIATLLSNKPSGKAQIINFNLEDIDDSLAKTIVKIFTRLFFDFTKKLGNRATMPFHIFLEEAHRYVQNDRDKDLLGYNIFERAAKEGRKYGLILNLISQRPVEINETVISQCSNFLIFKMNHPRDLDYIKKMLPNISSEIIEKQKILQPGTCVAFGKAFKVPMIVKMKMPSPEPYSGNCDVIDSWRVE